MHISQSSKPLYYYLSDRPYITRVYYVHGFEINILSTTLVFSQSSFIRISPSPTLMITAEVCDVNMLLNAGQQCCWMLLYTGQQCCWLCNISISLVVSVPSCHDGTQHCLTFAHIFNINFIIITCHRYRGKSCLLNALTVVLKRNFGLNVKQ